MLGKFDQFDVIFHQLDDKMISLKIQSDQFNVKFDQFDVNFDQLKVYRACRPPSRDWPLETKLNF